MTVAEHASTSSVTGFPEFAVNTADILKTIFVNDQPLSRHAIHCVTRMLLSYFESCPFALRGANCVKITQCVEQSYHALFLCDILYFYNGTFTASAYRGWLSTYLPYDFHETTVAELVQKRPLETDFWNYLSKFVVRGDVEEALVLIKRVEQSNDDLRKILSLLSHYPVDALPSSKQFRFWQDEARRAYKEAISQPARHVLGVLNGNLRLIMEHKTSSWLEKFSAVLHYRGGSPFSYEDVLRDMVNVHSLSDQERVLYALLLNQPEQAIKDAQSVWLWLATHMSILLSSAKVLNYAALPPTTNDFPATTLEHLTIAYADDIVHNSNLYQIAYWYYELCPHLGEPSLRKYVDMLANQIQSGGYRLDECRQILEFFKPFRDDIWAQLSKSLFERYKAMEAHHEGIRALTRVIMHASQREIVATAQVASDVETQQDIATYFVLNVELLAQVESYCLRLLFNAISTGDFSDILPFDEFSDDEKEIIPIIAFLSALSFYLGVEEDRYYDASVCELLYQLLTSTTCPDFMADYLFRIVADVLTPGGHNLFTGDQIDDMSAKLTDYERLVVPFASSQSQSEEWPFANRIHQQYDRHFYRKLRTLLQYASLYHQREEYNDDHQVPSDKVKWHDQM